MKVYKDLKALQDEQPYISKVVEVYCTDIDEGESFDTIFGGNVHVLETTDELAHITSLTGIDETGNVYESIFDAGAMRYANLLEAPGDFDIAVAHLRGEFFEFVLITNNSGGNAYFVPFSMAKDCPNIEKSLLRTMLFSDRSPLKDVIEVVKENPAERSFETLESVKCW